MKKLLLPLLFFTATASAQKVGKTEQVTDHSIHISKKNLNGIIFTGNYHEDIPELDTSELKERYTPSPEDIFAAEEILNKKIRYIDHDKRVPAGPYIYHNLPKYLRQYAGFIDSNNKKVIFINCFTLPKTSEGEFISIVKLTDKNGKVHYTAYPKKPDWFYHFVWADKAQEFCVVKVNIESKDIYAFSSSTNP